MNNNKQGEAPTGGGSPQGTEKGESVNYMQTIPDSHFWATIEMLIYNLQTHKRLHADSIDVNYLIIGLSNCLKNGYDIRPTPPQEATPSTGEKSGAGLIATERQRQIDVEGWDVSHDEDYAEGELIGAAGCYLASALSKHREDTAHTNQSPLAKFQIYDFGSYDPSTGRKRIAGWKDGWPWDKKWDKREKHNIVRSLVIAGALIAAHLDRLLNQFSNSEPIPSPTESRGEAAVDVKEAEFTDEEIKAAKETRDEIIKSDVAELKSIYMAGEIVMWDELRNLAGASYGSKSDAVEMQRLKELIHHQWNEKYPHPEAVQDLWEMYKTKNNL